MHGYGQSVDAQIAALTSAGAEKVFREVAGGAKTGGRSSGRLVGQRDPIEFVRFVPRGTPGVGDPPEAPGAAHLNEVIAEKPTGCGEDPDYCAVLGTLVQYAA